MTIGGVTTSDISDLDRICPMGDSNWVKFSWVAYIRSRRGATALEPDECRINPVGQICLTWTAATILEPDGDQINPVGQIYLTWGQICPTWPGCHSSGTRCKCPNWSDISD
jgi:hypothetical protein